MSDLSSIGFAVESMEEANALINAVGPLADHYEADKGSYFCFHDKSGAELWIQAQDNSIVGLNPHFDGKSRRTVSISAALDGEHSYLDGSYHAWAQSADQAEETEAEYPFVFDVSDFRVNVQTEFPVRKVIQLSAFAQNLSVHASEEVYNASQADEKLKFASHSFIPSGLFTNEGARAQAYAIFTGTIKNFAKLQNLHTGKDFYWFLVDTLGGEVDVLADPRLVNEEPRSGGILSGQFWLSGRIVSA